MSSQKVAVGLSGGVDSAVAAYLLKKQGFDVSGVYLHCFDDDAPGCRGKQDRQDAVKVALHLKIPFQVLDFRKQYKAAVIDYFKKEYLAGRTPNPDVVCNRDIKFGLFLDWAIKHHFDYIATGHYAKLIRSFSPGFNNYRHPERAERVEGSRPPLAADTNIASLDSSTSLRSARNDGKCYPKIFLVQPKDKHKDQTYFLWQVPKDRFRRVLFPPADITKKNGRSGASVVAKFKNLPLKVLGLVLLAFAFFLPWIIYFVTLGGAANTQPLIPRPSSFNIFQTLVNFVFGFQSYTLQAILISLWPMLILIMFFIFTRSHKLRAPGLDYFSTASFLPILLVFIV